MRTLLLPLVATTAACGASTCPVPAEVSEAERAATRDALAPPKRERPLIAVVAAVDGTETTDFLVPMEILARSGAADVVAVADEPGWVELMPALSVHVPTSLAAFEEEHPDGADYVVVPALHDPGNSEVLAFVERQYDGGAILIGVCSGGRVLAEAGLLDGRDGTGHWYDRGWLERHAPTMTWVADRRYVVDGGIATTTGVTASVPVALALVEAIVGTDPAAALGDAIGVATWDPGHDSDAFAEGDGYVGTVVANTLAVWSHERVEIPVADGVDALAVALAADAWSRTYRSQAVLTADRPTITTSSGLVVATEAARRGFTWSLPPTAPATVLDEALTAIDGRYGPRTAGWVARQLEYPGWCRP